jgi:hypothetical protein
MTQQQFIIWLEKLKEIWETGTPDGVVSLCADQFIWHETPFNEPLVTKEELIRDWRGILDQKDIKISYQILDIKDNIGIAKWHATFSRLSSKEEVELDGIFQVSLDKQGQCVEFHQWYNSKEQ